MGNNKKKKSQPRNVITTKTFLKKKVKVGKKIKKTNVTNTEFTAKSVVILNQFNDQTAEPVTQRGLTIRDLNRQIGHPSLPIRRDAVIGLKQLTQANQKLVEADLHDLVSSVGRLFSDEKFACDKLCVGNLKSLIRTMFTATEKSMSTSFELLSSHLRVGFTHSSVQVRKLTLEVLLLAFDAYPSLVRKDYELYESFLSFMRGTKKPNVRNLLKESVEKFRIVYESPESDENANVEFPPTDGWNAKSLDAFASRFYFPAFYSSKTVSKKTTDTSWLDQYV
ncbi:hypothetical protein M3Y97_00574500 [Aphelenchoides bicaudatus]|nr:hypothetical protein M3Y97_00574500 [Aphelenchoides bicaudatus]